VPRILFTIEYLGTRYAGWQRQTNAIAIQQLFEEALEIVFGRPVTAVGAGRTDAGVHALAQRAHADVPFDIPARGLVLGLNSHLPPDIRVKDAVEVGVEFHSRFAAIRKTYLYQIWNAPVASVYFGATHAHVRRVLDIESMRVASRAFVGTHDFKSYTVADPEVASTERTIESVDVSVAMPRIRIRFAANGFLRYQVRRMAGMLIEIGQGQLPVSAAAEALEPTFGPARWTADACGLLLERVDYPVGAVL
jgi:tRNA pseudouridine38-40 synthase